MYNSHNYSLDNHVFACQLYGFACFNLFNNSTRKWGNLYTKHTTVILDWDDGEGDGWNNYIFIEYINEVHLEESKSINVSVLNLIHSNCTLEIFV